MEDSFIFHRLQRIKWLLGEVYPLTRDAIIYYEILTGEMNYFGMSELRDATEHMRRAFFAETEEDFNRDIENAFEHMRRGATESLQRAAVQKLKKAMELLKIPSLGLKMAFVEIPEKIELRELKNTAFSKLNEGRCSKSDKDKWVDAMECFHDVIKCSFDIIDIYPPRAEIRFRIVQILSALITTSSLIVAVYMFLAS